MEKEILEKNKQYLKKLYFWWLEYFDVWNLSDYDENDLIDSPLSQILQEDNEQVEILIYRLPDSNWTLEVVNQNGTSTVWDETFPSDQEALSVALDGIKAAGGIQAFSEISDLEAKKNIFPERSQKLLYYMSLNNWLVGYASFEGLQRAFNGIAKRTPFVSNMEHATEVLKADYEFFESNFFSYFPVLENFVENTFFTL